MSSQGYIPYQWLKPNAYNADQRSNYLGVSDDELPQVTKEGGFISDDTLRSSHNKAMIGILQQIVLNPQDDQRREYQTLRESKHHFLNSQYATKDEYTSLWIDLKAEGVFKDQSRRGRSALRFCVEAWENLQSDEYEVGIPSYSSIKGFLSLPGVYSGQMPSLNGIMDAAQQANDVLHRLDSDSAWSAFDRSSSLKDLQAMSGQKDLSTANEEMIRSLDKASATDWMTSVGFSKYNALNVKAFAQSITPTPKTYRVSSADDPSEVE
ncbi:uncharacterized protein L199_002049 [Kwoniella botswanensis]|uniref:uncharacterized protein n=1 Tax=Kwoniella botswanensis TaxID=1268659 RepID=UPI00315D9039